MGQKMVCFAALCGTRSRQDESKEVHEVGSKRPSSGGNGGHVLSLYPLIWRSLLVYLLGDLRHVSLHEPSLGDFDAASRDRYTT